VSFNRFNLDERLSVGIQSAGYSTPTPIQIEAISHILDGRDVIGIAQTGTGKTAAFMLPILHRLMQSRGRGVRALVLAPTRELAEQIHQATQQFAARTGLRSAAIYGGVGKRQQVEQLRRGADVVVACPGRLLDLAGEGSLDLSRVEVLVLDEADRMCDMGFLPDIRRVLKLVAGRQQTLMFSATMPDEIRRLADGMLRTPVVLQVGESAPPKTVSHALYPVAGVQKKELLLAVLKGRTSGRALIFARTKQRARGLARDLDKQGYRVQALQGNMTQNRRQEAIDGFRRNRYDILVATDIASRGIDVADIAHVINFDMPDTPDAYTHRVGRTGRMSHMGEALTLAEPKDEIMVSQIERVLGEPIERRRLDGFDYSKGGSGALVFMQSGLRSDRGAAPAGARRPTHFRGGAMRKARGGSRW
jgi:ATP-dependent RNA helicase RhlE